MAANPIEQARRDWEHNGEPASPGMFLDALEEYVTWRLHGAFYSFGMASPPANPQEGVDYYRETMQLMLPKLLGTPDT